MPAIKGAFINLGARLLGTLPNMVVFQFNPEQVTRTPRMVLPLTEDDGSGSHNARQQPGPPSETLSFTLYLDATDQLARRSALAAASGILPALSALEMLITPRRPIANNLAALALGAGRAQLHPPDELPPVLFFWGPFRILPVAINSLSITENRFDRRLNPVRAEVSVNLQVLTPNQLKGGGLPLGAYKYSARVRQTMAAVNLANAAQMGEGAILSLLL